MFGGGIGKPKSFAETVAVFSVFADQNPSLSTEVTISFLLSIGNPAPSTNPKLLFF